MTIKSKILNIVDNKRNIRGLTTAQVHAKLVKAAGFGMTPYSSTRGRLYELASAGEVYQQYSNNPTFAPSVFLPMRQQTM